MRLYISKYALKTGKDIEYIYYVLLSISLKNKDKEMLQKGKFPNAPHSNFYLKNPIPWEQAVFLRVTRHEKWVSVQPHNFYLSHIYYQKNVHK